MKGFPGEITFMLLLGECTRQEGAEKGLNKEVGSVGRGRTEEVAVGAKAPSWVSALTSFQINLFKGMKLQGHVSFRRCLWGHCTDLSFWGGHCHVEKG